MYWQHLKRLSWICSLQNHRIFSLTMTCAKLLLTTFFREKKHLSNDFSRHCVVLQTLNRKIFHRTTSVIQKEHSGPWTRQASVRFLPVMALPQPIKRHSLWGLVQSCHVNYGDWINSKQQPSRLAQPGILNDFGPALMYLHFEAKRMNFFSPRIKIGVWINSAGLN